MLPMQKAKTRAPARARHTAYTLSISLTGVMSPYPTVERVTIAKYIAVRYFDTWSVLSQRSLSYLTIQFHSRHPGSPFEHEHSALSRLPISLSLGIQQSLVRITPYQIQPHMCVTNTITAMNLHRRSTVLTLLFDIKTSHFLNIRRILKSLASLRNRTILSSLRKPAWEGSKEHTTTSKGNDERRSGKNQERRYFFAINRCSATSAPRSSK
mmetsp:Transcript_34112/g.79939  ORF Transcript_34112/g.79939 Transcript_34112/m.79939 type:complete len:211 (-) Transcript_34112:786-1418(-)